VRRVERSSVTLILGGVWNGYALHASDRQVSKRKKPSSPYEAHDLHSNKTIIVVARDCWLGNRLHRPGVPRRQAHRPIYCRSCLTTGTRRRTVSALRWLPGPRAAVYGSQATDRGRLDNGLFAPRPTSQGYSNHGVDRGDPAGSHDWNILVKFSVQAGLFSLCPDKPKRHLPRNDWELTHAGTQEPAVLHVL